MIEIEAILNQDKQCIKIMGDGSAQIVFETDGTQLAQVLSSLAQFKGRTIKLTLEGKE